MSENSGRASDSVPPAPERAAERPSLIFQVRSPGDIVIEDVLKTRVDLNPVQARTTRQQFAEQLAQLAEHVKGRRRELHGSPDACPPATEDDALRLTPEKCEEYLEALRFLGAGLRGALGEDFLSKAGACGFPAAEGEEEPGLIFVETKDQVHLLWDMVYEGTLTGPLEWQRFWGFRVPITHWMLMEDVLPPPKEIRVRNGLFTAISEDLAGAGREESMLRAGLQRWGAWLRHGDLAQAVRERVLREWKGPPDAPSIPADWCRCHLQKLSAVQQARWKRTVLEEVFKDARSRYELIHFACHCQASTLTELYSCLVMHVAGEPLALDNTLMLANLQHRRRSMKEPGPLVFLNACGTSQPMPTGEPPGFPETWLKFGALAVIVTLCPVPDHFAYAFARKFYELLFEVAEGPGVDRSRYLAEALLATRRYFMEKYHNPLGLAYVLYAREGAHVLPERQ
jgi:hypothetical protein